MDWRNSLGSSVSHTALRVVGGQSLRPGRYGGPCPGDRGKEDLAPANYGWASRWRLGAPQGSDGIAAAPPLADQEHGCGSKRPAAQPGQGDAPIPDSLRDPLRHAESLVFNRYFGGTLPVSLCYTRVAAFEFLAYLRAGTGDRDEFEALGETVKPSRRGCAWSSDPLQSRLARRAMEKVADG